MADGTPQCTIDELGPIACRIDQVHPRCSMTILEEPICHIDEL